MISSGYKDHFGRPIVAVTGIGVLTSLGQGLYDNWQALISGKSGIHEITRFSTEGLSTRIAGSIDFIASNASNPVERSYIFAHQTIVEALAQAGFSGDFKGPLFLAAPPIEPEWNSRFFLADRAEALSIKFENVYERFLAVMRKQNNPDFYESVLFGSISERIADKFCTTGLPVTVSTACASGATAIKLGVESIRQKQNERALVVATDGSLSVEALVRFSLLSTLSTQNEFPEKASKPFSKDRDGFVIAEGAATLVLETLESAVARGAKVLSIIKGWGEKTDHFHRTRSSPDGGPAVSTICAALIDANVRNDEVGYINAHGTSTPENDKTEYIAMSKIFGDNLASIPVSSNKSMIGHTLTAAGAIEAVFAIQSMISGVLPPTINYIRPDPAIVLDCVPNIKRNTSVEVVMSNSFGFGGQNISLIMTREPM
ncbi:3-oxoacyl-(acyl-carrier-protein) synthase, KASII [Liberibacter crescens BT-1]|uniref:3-oxoacyl-(Acyl-carrier-protein) synthase, KASII n=1 Tax=Liberibacter crescens (strain BT-1) TaxID=1215343 RepID=L0EVT2_LIBCB|nr:beta-ketoacyl-ACP synthase [Liberibacter crescens]AGA64965.1 3-oxoacyl-(acyl-carrier-protein) synthase, KASII [Liberibacter crescens BT-1]AMC12984.1 3-oxoacyl-ACP synthase [Liberibacter crescens]